MKKAVYLVKLYKSINKTMQDAINAVVWYTMTDEEQKEIEEIIKKIW